MKSVHISDSMIRRSFVVFDVSSEPAYGGRAGSGEGRWDTGEGPTRCPKKFGYLPPAATCRPGRLAGSRHLKKVARDGDSFIVNPLQSGLRSRFEHQVERGLSCSAKACEPAGLDDLANARLSGLRAQPEANFLRQ